jgi:hypothetical protein
MTTYVETAEAKPTTVAQTTWPATTIKAQDATMALASTSTVLEFVAVLLATARCTPHKKWPML